MDDHRIYHIAVADVYPHYVAKAEKKGRGKVEVDEIMCWLTGYRQAELEKMLSDGTDFATFFARAPAPQPLRDQVSGVVCGIRVEDLELSVMREIRIMDKLVDDLTKVRETANLALLHKDQSS